MTSSERRATLGALPSPGRLPYAFRMSGSHYAPTQKFILSNCAPGRSEFRNSYPGSVGWEFPWQQGMRGNELRPWRCSPGLGGSLPVSLCRLSLLLGGGPHQPWTRGWGARMEATSADLWDGSTIPLTHGAGIKGTQMISVSASLQVGGGGCPCPTIK